MSEYVLCAWSIRFVLCSDTKSLKPKYQTKTKVLHAPEKGGREVGNRSFVLYRMETERFLKWPKSLHDQVAIELSALMGLRSREVCTLLVENLFFDRGECLVLDCKKDCLLPVPTHRVVMYHIELLVGDRTEGPVVENTSTSCRSRRDEPISTTANWMICHKNAVAANLFPTPYDYSPLTLRQYFACLWYNYLHLDLVALSKIMRHTHPEQTLKYCEQLYFWEDIRSEYAKFEEATTPHVQDFKQMEQKARIP